MKIMLVNIPYEDSYRKVSSAKGKFPPMGLAYLAGYLRQKHEVLVLDAANLEIGMNDVMKYIPKDVDIVGVALLTPMFHKTIQFLRLIKKEIGCLTAVGGSHVSAQPNETVAYDDSIDFGVIGEGELVFEQLLDALETGESLETIKGLVYRDGRKVIVNPGRQYIENLDTLPFPAYDLLPMHVYAMSAHHTWSKERINFSPMASVFSSRGCPFRCSFCASKVVWGVQVRYKSVEYFLSEIDYLVKEFGVKALEISDDSFLLNTKRAHQFLDGMIERNYDLNFCCMTRADDIKPELVPKLKRAKCHLVRIGVESCDDTILKKMKKDTSVKKIAEAFYHLKKGRIACSALMMIGYPGDTRESFMRSLNRLKKMGPDAADFYISIPLVGTELYEICESNGYIVNENKEDWVQMTTNPVIRTDTLSPADMLDLRKKAYRSFYLRPGHILNVLSNIRSWEQLKFFIKGGLAFLSVAKE